MVVQLSPRSLATLGIRPKNLGHLLSFLARQPHVPQQLHHILHFSLSQATQSDPLYPVASLGFVLGVSPRLVPLLVHRAGQTRSSFPVLNGVARPTLKCKIWYCC